MDGYQIYRFMFVGLLCAQKERKHNKKKKNNTRVEIHNATFVVHNVFRKYVSQAKWMAKSLMTSLLISFFTSDAMSTGSIISLRYGLGVYVCVCICVLVKDVHGLT